MDNQEQFLEAVNDFQIAAQKNNGFTAERWLNVAYKLDYISLHCKENIDALLRKRNEIQHFDAKHRISKQDIKDMVAITKIATNTKFWPIQLSSI